MSGYAGSGFAFDYLTASSTFPTSPCSLPPLPEGRYAHASAFLPGGKLVICGGRDFNKTVLDSCLSWQPGNSTWHYFYTMRYVTTKDRKAAVMISTVYIECHDAIPISGLLPPNLTSSFLLEPLVMVMTRQPLRLRQSQVSISCQGGKHTFFRWRRVFVGPS